MRFQVLYYTTESSKLFAICRPSNQDRKTPIWILTEFDTSAEELKLEDIDFESIQDGYKKLHPFFFQLVNFMRVNSYQLLLDLFVHE